MGKKERRDRIRTNTKGISGKEEQKKVLLNVAKDTAALIKRSGLTIARQKSLIHALSQALNELKVEIDATA